MKVEFKYANVEDLSLIVETYNSTIPSQMVTADLIPVSVESKLAWFYLHSNEKRPLWLVMCDEQYAGWMSFNSFYGRPAYDGTVEVSIYLAEQFRYKGLGKICLQMAIDVAPSLNIHTLLGYIFGHNANSLSLFHQFNFENWALLPKIANMNGVMRDLVIVGLKTKHTINLNS